jgi:tryptophan synthase alpha chain
MSSPVNALDKALERARADGRTGLMTHIVLGYPTLLESRQIVERMARAGVDIIEVQIPFSDPTADGPVISRASQTALDGGVRVADAFAFMEDVTARYDTAFVFMSYFNIAFAYRAGANDGRGGSDGVAGFVAASANAGASGLILPDVPPEMATREGYPQACAQHGIHPIHVVSPNVGEDRLQAVASVATGLLYATSRTGTTGREMDLEMERLTQFLAQAKEICGLPVAVGFSISKPEQIAALSGHADIAVIGTHLIRVYQQNGLDGVEKALVKLRAAG